MYQLNGKTTDRLLKEAHELSNLPSERELDVLLSSGEQISISKLSILLSEMGYETVSLTGWQAGIFTNNVNQNATIEYIDTSRILKELSERKIVIIAGFQGINEHLDITTLGRGGSDTTAVAVAAALKADHCYIFSDVDGVYTADPNKISSAKKLQSLSYAEMLDISNEGAKVLHNRCVEIGEKFKIPIIAKSTFNDKPGSVIKEDIEDKTVKSIVKNDDIFLLNLKNDSNSDELFKDVYDILINNNILPIQVINNSINTFDVNFLIKGCCSNKIQELLNKDLNNYNNTIKYISRIAVVGHGITSDSTVLAKIISIVNTLNVTIYCIDITNTKIIITFDDVVDDNLLELLHGKLF